MAGDLVALFNEMLRNQGSNIASAPTLQSTVRSQRRRAKEKARRIEDICILDFETDPFDNKRPHDEVYPFLAVLYRNGFDPIVIWDDNHERLIDKVFHAIETMEGRYTIYAHNGGRFDYKFLLHKLRGEIKFKGNSIMSAKIGEHELRDSLHILPTNLGSLKKDAFDYKRMHKSERNKHRDEIIEYCINDCKYALEFIQFFVSKHGFKISIGQAAFAGLKRIYTTIENLNERKDAIFRQFFFGGRVEFFEGHIHEKKTFQYIDLNSAYPAVMANVRHPIGTNWTEDTEVTRDTFFIELKCFSNGALIQRIRNDAGVLETRQPFGNGHFFTTIHEYKAALELGLITNIEIISTWNCSHATTFEQFIVPLYNRRREITARMAELVALGLEDGEEYDELNKNQTIIKFELNNAYGKFAQDPTRYKETMQLGHGKAPEGDSWEIIFVARDYVVWERPNQSEKYNNVATGASITGAQRAVLMRALHAVERPLYCDTDSIICEGTGELEMHPTQLGAWKLEAVLDELIINGKKHYAYHNAKKDKWTVRCKGAGGITLEQVIAVNQGLSQTVWQKGITLRNDGSQYYTHRAVRKTGNSEKHRIRANG